MADKVVTMMENKGFDPRHCDAVRKAREDTTKNRRTFRRLFRGETNKDRGLIGKRFTESLKDTVSK